jgi:hypothetical protein
MSDGWLFGSTLLTLRKRCMQQILGYSLTGAARHVDEKRLC